MVLSYFSGNKILIFDMEASYPEDCYSVVQDEQGKFSFNEVHRDNVEMIFTSDKLESVVIYAVAYAKKDSMRNNDDEFRRTIMPFASEHSSDEMVDYLNAKIDGNLYSVGTDEYDKISLVFVGEKGSLYYHNKPIHLVQNASIKRCF
jgi:hypothetical protein